MALVLALLFLAKRYRASIEPNELRVNKEFSVALPFGMGLIEFGLFAGKPIRLPDNAASASHDRLEYPA
jgi:hypothetical protein